MRSCELRLYEAHRVETGDMEWREIPEASRRRRRKQAVLPGTILLLGAFLLAGTPRFDRPAPAMLRVVVVEGDTLWSLAIRHCGSNQYLPKAVYEIRRINSLSTSALYPGQEIILPIQAPGRFRWEPRTGLAVSGAR